MRRCACLLVLAACGDNAPDPRSCAVYARPERAVSTGCGDPTDPRTLVACDTGSADIGTWAIDDDGLPAFDLLVDERCDPAATAYSPRKEPLRDPLHVVGDGYGLVAMAHASGGLDLYTQDRGHKWPVRIDMQDDDAAYPHQLGAAVGYVVDAGRVRSTRFEDLPVDRALALQTRRFGVGYVETTTQLDELSVTRRTYALTGTRALITEVTIENPSDRERMIGVVELDDVNFHQLAAELATSDLLVPTITRDIDRRRRAAAAQLAHEAHYEDGVAWIETTSSASLGRDEVAPIDHYPETLWLTSLDAAPDAAWLHDAELWPSASREPPAHAADDRAPPASTRALSFGGAGQPGILALRVPVRVPARGSVTTRFAFGSLPSGDDPRAAAGAVRAMEPDARRSAIAWRDRLVWAALPGQPDAGALQRELAWSSYTVQALATYDAYYGTRLLGQGGSYKYIHGIDGAIGDYALFAEALLPIDPALAADTLALSLATQRAQSLPDAGRYPYATTGVGDFTDVVRYDRRSDAYFLLPSTIARYVAITRDDAFLDRVIPFWPRAAGDEGTVVEHLRRTQQFADTTLGFGAHGIVAMGTNDYADGVLQTATEPATPTGASSTFNAWLLVGGFQLASEIVCSRDATLADRYAALRADQLARLEQHAWNGRWYERGFVDSGSPLGAQNLYLEPQVLPIVARVVDPARRAALLDLVTDVLDTPIGPMTVLPVGAGAATGDIDEPQVGGVWPVASAWLTEAYALHDPARGWDSLVRNTLFAHARAFPHLWYGVWSGPDSYYGPDAERPGEADAHLATALTDYPVLNTHAHGSVLRALFALAGIRGAGDGIAIAPLLPTETYAIVWPQLSLTSTPTSIGGTLRVASAPFTLRVRLPSGLRASTPRVTVDTTDVAFTRDGDDVIFTIPSPAASWQVGP